MFNSVNVRSLAAKTIALVTVSLFAGSALASGGGGGGGFSGSGGSFGNRAPAPRVVDEAYEYGKAVYLGRSPGAQKIDYCVVVDGEAKKVKRTNLKPYKGVTRQELANALYNCDNSEQLALRSVSQEEVPFVLYYLDKRFRLNLSDS